MGDDPLDSEENPYDGSSVSEADNANYNVSDARLPSVEPNIGMANSAVTPVSPNRSVKLLNLFSSVAIQGEDADAIVDVGVPENLMPGSHSNGGRLMNISRTLAWAPQVSIAGTLQVGVQSSLDAESSTDGPRYIIPEGIADILSRNVLTIGSDDRSANGILSSKYRLNGLHDMAGWRRP